MTINEESPIWLKNQDPKVINFLERVPRDYLEGIVSRIEKEMY